METRFGSDGVTMTLRGADQDVVQWVPAEVSADATRRINIDYLLDALAALGADLSERHRCLQVGAAEVHRRGRTSRKKLIDQVGVDFLREINVRELRFQREGALIEPPVERLVERKRRLRPLG